MKINVRERKKKQHPNNDRITVAFNEDLKIRLVALSEKYGFDIHDTTREVWLELISKYEALDKQEDACAS